MKRIILNVLFLIIIASCSKDSNQNTEEQFCGIYEGTVLLRTMIEIEEFAKCNYTEITGTLRILDGNVQYPITDLSSLSSLTKIGGNLSIGNLSVLTSLEGLHNITSTNYFFLTGAEVLTNLDALENMQTSRMEIWDNPLLQNIDGLDMESDTMRTIVIINCPLLTDFNCFSNIKTITNSLSIKDNVGLTDLYGFQNIEAIGTNYTADCCGALQLTGNDNLESINELNNLTYIKGGVTISDNFYLDNINGLSNVSTLDGELIITYNTYLQNLDGFQSLNRLDGDIRITDNSLLSRFCGLQNLFLSNGHSGAYEVFRNYSNPTPTNILYAPPCD